MALRNFVHRAPERFLGRAVHRSLCSSEASVCKKHGYKEFKSLALVQPSEGVYQVEINRPDKANAMSKGFFTELRECFNAIAGDPDCRAVVICGSGKVFSSGIDIEEYAPMFSNMAATSAEGSKDPARKSVEIARFVTEMQESIASLDRCSKPVVSAIHSACIGSGVDLVCATDIRLASSDAWFSVKEVDIGLCADLGTLQRLPKLIGSDSLSRELIFTARRFPAAEALSAGFLSSVFDSKHAVDRGWFLSPTGEQLEVVSTPNLDMREEMMDRAVSLGSEIAARSPVAIRGSKINLNYSRDHPVDQALQFQSLWSSAMLQTLDITKAVKAAAQRKPPPPFPPL